MRRLLIGSWCCLVALMFTTSSRAADAPLAAKAFFPSAGAKDVCPDTPLRITFARPPVIGSGKIQIIDSADGSVVDTIDVATPTRIATIGGLENFNVYPILIDGDVATIYPLSGALKYGKSYGVKLDAGTFKDSAGGEFAGTDSSRWRFSTRSAAPKNGTASLTVADDGSGDFATVQGAIDFIPENNTTPTTITIKDGTYHEIVVMLDKNDVTLSGEDRGKTIIAYPNNDRFNHNSHGNPFAAGAPAPGKARPHHGGIYHRGMFLAHHCKNLTLTNLTLHNTTPLGGSQAEALILNGTADANARVIDVDLYSFQDTLQVNGQAQVEDCFIEGDVDFMWGSGPCFFDHCHCRSLRSKAYYTQVRNRPGTHGFVYKDCTFDGAPGVVDNYLSRIEPQRFPDSEVVLINCTMTDAVGPVAWLLQKSNVAPNVHFWEYNSHSPDGKPVDTSQRLAVSRQLKLPQDKALIEHYSDPAFVLSLERPRQGH